MHWTTVARRRQEASRRPLRCCTLARSWPRCGRLRLDAAVVDSLFRWAVLEGEDGAAGPFEDGEKLADGRGIVEDDVIGEEDGEGSVTDDGTRSEDGVPV